MNRLSLDWKWLKYDQSASIESQGFSEKRLVSRRCDKKDRIFSFNILMVAQLSYHGGEDIGRGLLRQILREIELSPDDFLKLLK